MKTIPTTHVGSLPRPQEMITKMLRKEEITVDELRKYLGIVMEKQLDLGLTYVNNGELPRADYVNSTARRISGFGGAGTAPLPKDLEEVPELSRRFSGRNGLITLNPKAPVQLPVCTAPLAYIGASTLREELEMMIQVHQEVAARRPGMVSGLFFTAPSPGTLALFMENQHYPTYEKYLESLGAVLVQEYELIADHGLQLQIDCPDLAMGRHTRFKHLTDDEFLAVLAINVEALNIALSSVDSSKCRVHVCWGNYQGTHHCDIDLRRIFDRIMTVKAKFISLEASNHRHSHEWSVFKEMTLPEDKVLLPGVIDTSTNVVEHPDLVCQRIRTFADILGPDRLVASTDCGFATTASASSVAGEVAWLKLASLVEGARRAARHF